MPICCVALQSLVTATYEKIRLIPRDSRALPLKHFIKAV